VRRRERGRAERKGNDDALVLTRSLILRCEKSTEAICVSRHEASSIAVACTNKRPPSKRRRVPSHSAPYQGRSLIGQPLSSLTAQQTQCHYVMRAVVAPQGGENCFCVRGILLLAHGNERGRMGAACHVILSTNTADYVAEMQRARDIKQQNGQACARARFRRQTNPLCKRRTWGFEGKTRGDGVQVVHLSVWLVAALKCRFARPFAGVASAPNSRPPERQAS